MRSIALKRIRAPLRGRLPRAALAAASLAPAAAQTTPAGAAAHENAFEDPAFARPLADGLRAFYGARFTAAQDAFEHALAVVPDDTFALSFLAASAAQRPGELDALTDRAEEAAGAAPNAYAAHVRLGFVYLFDSTMGRARGEDARDEFAEAERLRPDAAAPHVGLGVMRFDARSPSRAKLEFLTALRDDPSAVLALEYLASLYQNDLHEPQRGLAYAIEVPNLVPGYADIDFHIGSLLADLRQNADAIVYVKRGLALDPGRVGEAGRHGETLLARIYLAQNRPALARAALASALAAHVDTIYAQTLLAKIASAPSPSPSAASTAGAVPQASVAPQPSATPG